MLTVPSSPTIYHPSSRARPHPTHTRPNHAPLGCPAPTAKQATYRWHTIDCITTASRDQNNSIELQAMTGDDDRSHSADNRDGEQPLLYAEREDTGVEE